MQKTDRSRTTTVAPRKLNQAVTLIAAALLDVVSLLKQINTTPGTRYVAIDLADALFLSTYP